MEKSVIKFQLLINMTRPWATTGLLSTMSFLQSQNFALRQLSREICGFFVNCKSYAVVSLWLLMCIPDFFLPLTTEPKVVRQKAANCKYQSEYEVESLAINLINYTDFFLRK